MPPWLSTRQRRLLAHVASDRTVAAAAEELGFSRSYGYNELQRIKRELGRRTVAGCVSRAQFLGMLSHPTSGGRVVLPL